MIHDDQLAKKRLKGRRQALMMMAKRKPRAGVQGSPKASNASLPKLSIQKGNKE